MELSRLEIKKFLIFSKKKNMFFIFQDEASSLKNSLYFGMEFSSRKPKKIKKFLIFFLKIVLSTFQEETLNLQA